jgi:ligand-binding SRPBCC domain-containing protein
MPLIRLETFINAPVELCFDLSRDLDVHVASSGSTGERAIAGVTSGMVQLGDTVTWEATHFGVRQRLTSKIIAFDRPHFFVDVMLRGVFKRWHHTHLFEEQPSGTLMIDEVDYSSPLGLLGWVVDKLYLENYMRAFLIRRNAHIKSVAENRKEVEAVLSRNIIS